MKKLIFLGIILLLYFLFLRWYGGCNMLERSAENAWWLFLSVAMSFGIPTAVAFIKSDINGK